MTSLGQFGVPRKGKKQGFFGEDVEDISKQLSHSSMYPYLDAPLFQPNKEILTPASPSKQLTGFDTSSIYGQTSGNLVMSQRSMSNAPFQRNATPTSIATAPSFPMSLQQPSQQASPNRNVFSFTQQRGLFGQFPNQSVVSSGQMKRPNAISAAIMSSVGSNALGMSAFSRLPGGDASQANLDLTDFPTLGNRTAMPNPLPAGRNYVGMVSKPVSEPAPEFHIQQEDFPALPGAQSVADAPMSTSVDSSNKSSSVFLGPQSSVFLGPQSSVFLGPQSSVFLGPQSSVFLGPQSSVFLGPQSSVFLGPQSSVFLGPQSSVFLGPHSSVFLGPQSSVYLGPQSSVFLGPQSSVFLGSQSSVFLGPQSSVFLGPQSSVFLGPQSSVFLGPHSSVFLGPQSSVFLGPQSSVFLGPQSSVFLGPQSSVFLGPQSSVFLGPQSSVFLGPQSSVFLGPQSSVFLGPQSSVFLGPQSSVFLGPHSSVFLCPQSSVFLDPQSSVFLGPQSSVFLGPHSSVFLGPQSSVCLGPQSSVFLGPQGSVFLGPHSSVFLGPQGSVFLGPQSSVFLGPQSSVFLGPQNSVFLGPQSSVFLGPQSSVFLGPQSSVFLGPQSSVFLGPQSSVFLGPHSSVFLGPHSSVFLGPQSSVCLGPQSSVFLGPHSSVFLGPQSSVCLGPQSSVCLGPQSSVFLGPQSSVFLGPHSSVFLGNYEVMIHVLYTAFFLCFKSSWLSDVYNGCLQQTSVPYDQALKDSVNMKPDGQRKQGIHTHPDGTISNIPPGMVGDQFGMVGLLTFIRAAETDPNLVALAPGIDLTTLGLNLNSPENLYSTFQSPWADAPCRPQDIDFHVPTEYLTNIYIRDKLAPIKLNRYGEDLLFFLFYMNGGDVLQLASATELYDRDWRYHKEEHVWITRVPSVEASVKTNTFERGTYYFFDAQNWVKVPKDFHLEYDKLEERPHLPQMPPTLHHGGTAGAGTAPAAQPTSVMSH
ncbi:hypothetical protein LSAT2_022949 [Lamellibrachia satsuma]|nr:hypothetical protein LSAT2_022949 [Lamellibrachia satsuma]